MRLLLLSLCSFCLLFTAGCIRSETVIYLKGDGSGTITVTESISGAGQKMLEQAGPQAAAVTPMMEQMLSTNQKQLTAQAVKWGKNITLEKVEVFNKPDGTKGRKAIYGFKDINEVILAPDNPGSQPGDETGAPTTFKYSGNELIIKIPENKANDQKEMARMQQMKQIPPQMKEMLKDMFISVILKTEKKISSTNAYYQLPGKDGIVLTEIAFGKLINDGAAIDEFSKTPPSDRAKTHEAMKKYPYMKYENQDEITVKF